MLTAKFFCSSEDGRRITVVEQVLNRPIASLASLWVERDTPVALIVDDDPQARGISKEILEGAGWRVLQANCGEQALLLAREHVPEVILLDLALPRMSGIEVLRELKSNRWADQPTAVVVVSFYAMLMRLPDLNLADAYVQKPFAATDLLAQITAARRRMRPLLAVDAGSAISATLAPPESATFAPQKPSAPSPIASTGSRIPRRSRSRSCSDDDSIDSR
jgi:DNA-binding response OmpR family regulator